MQIPLQISYENVPESAALSAYIRQKADKLEQVYERLTGCRVRVALPHKHSTRGECFEVHVEMSVPGAEPRVGGKNDPDVYVALRDAFDAALRQLESLDELRGGRTKNHAELRHGAVVRLLDGYGFIEDDQGYQYYFSSENMVGSRFDKLAEGAEVRFLPETASQGLQAKRVNVVKPHRMES
jgi:ribosome-associated translation inhibitor RaiA/cold shock CspA family protein